MNTEHTRYPYDKELSYCSTHNDFEPRIKGFHYSEIEAVVESIDLPALDIDTKKVAIVREFISALLLNLQKRDSYKVPAVAGIATIEDDFTFIQWVYVTRDLLWD